MPEQHFSNWDEVPLLLTVEEVAGLLRLHQNSVKRLLREGKLAGIKAGRAWRIRREALLAFLNAGGVGEEDES
jgi:excisionase family DNA binding protein